MPILDKFLKWRIPARPNKKAHLIMKCIFSVTFIISAIQLGDNIMFNIFAGMLLFWQRYLVLEISSLKGKLSKYEIK